MMHSYLLLSTVGVTTQTTKIAEIRLPSTAKLALLLYSLLPCVCDVVPPFQRVTKSGSSAG